MRALPGGGEAPYELNTSFFDAMGHTFKGRTTTRSTGSSAPRPSSCRSKASRRSTFTRCWPRRTITTALRGAGMNRAINRHRWDYPELQGAAGRPEQRPGPGAGGACRRASEAARPPTGLSPQRHPVHPPACDARVFGVWRQALDRHAIDLRAAQRLRRDCRDPGGTSQPDRGRGLGRPDFRRTGSTGRGYPSRSPPTSAAGSRTSTERPARRGVKAHTPGRWGPDGAVGGPSGLETACNAIS